MQDVSVEPHDARNIARPGPPGLVSLPVVRDRIADAARTRARLIRPFPAAEVTRISDMEVPAREAGLDQNVVDRIWASVESLYAEGVFPAMSLCVRKRGLVILNRSIGHTHGNGVGAARDERRIVATPESPFHLFSASKCVTAMLVHLLDDQGKIHLDDSVAEYIPEFSRHGKHRITIRHVLTHRAGIPTVPGEAPDLDLLTRPEEIIDFLCDVKPMARAGRRLQYHALTGGYILAEIMRRVTGKDIETLLDEYIRQPLGMTWFTYGVRDRAGHERLPQHACTGPRARFPHSQFFIRAFGVTHEQLVGYSNDPRYALGVVPSGNIVATAEETSRFFECLLRDGEYDGRRVFDRRTVHRATAEQSYLEFDSFITIPVRYGMGFMLGSEYASLYGPGTSRAFGHLGFTNVVAWADPERDVSVCFNQTGKPFLTLRLLRWWWVMRTISSSIPRVRRPAR